jgi:hypothetical protein
MKKTDNLLFGSLVAAFIILLTYNTTAITFAAGGGAYIDTVTASPSSATINSTITIDAYIYNYKCSTPDSYGNYYEVEDPNYCASHGYGSPIETAVGGLTRYIEVSGSGNTVSPASIKANASGHANFTVTSSVAEAKTVTIYEPGRVKRSSTTITFKAPASTPAPKKTTTTTPAPAPEVAAPAALTPESIQVDGKSVTADQKVSVQQDKSLIVTGKTVANGVVTIYVFSEPKKYTVAADKDGNWTYSLSGLEPGDHHVEAEVTDPATNKTSTRGTILSFAVTAPAKATIATTPVTKSTKNPTVMILGVLLVVLAVIFGYLWFFKRDLLNRIFKNKAKTTIPTTPPTAPPSQK